MEIDRTKLIASIGRVLPAVARKELFEQASRIALQDGFLVAYNDAVSIFDRLPECEGIEGAVDGRRLHELLTRLSADVVTLSAADDKLLVRAGRTRTTFDMLPVGLPLGEIDRTGEDAPLPAGFSEALRLVAGCCAREMSRPVLTCVRIGGEEVEASDGYRLGRVRFPGSELPEALIPVTEAEVICDYDVATIGVGESGEWVRFSARDGGTTIHARATSGRFPDLAAVYEVEGASVVLPSALGEAVERARIFARRDHRIDEHVSLALRPGRIEVSASADGVGEFSEVVRWDGEAEATLSVHPDFLTQALRRGTSCVVGPDRIMFSGENWRHVVALKV